MVLFIQDKKINRISGPISFTLLKPKKEVFDRLLKEGVRLPIMMLFGDEHDSSSFQCDSCKCLLNSNDCCMPVYSEEFLQLIDSLATKEHPVDFGIEGSLEGGETRENYKEKGWLQASQTVAKELNTPLTLLREYISACYYKELRDTKLYEEFCPTKRIRWHQMDARYFKGTKYNLEEKIANDDWDIKLFEELPKEPEKLDEIVSKLKIYYGDLYYKILNFKRLAITDVEGSIDYFFSIATQNNSILLKQIYKLTGSIKDIEMWKNVFKTYFLRKLVLLRERASTNFLKKYIHNKIYNQSIKNAETIYSLLIKDDLKTLKEKLPSMNYFLGTWFISDLLVEYYTTFLDLYYVLRTFKVPQGDINPFLSVSYFGDFHTQEIKYLLTNILEYYSEVYSISNKTDKNYRCLNIIKDVNLNKIALEYGFDILGEQRKNKVETIRKLVLGEIYDECKESGHITSEQLLNISNELKDNKSLSNRLNERLKSFGIKLNNCSVKELVSLCNFKSTTFPSDTCLRSFE
jgi:hypothetical protein